MTPKHHLQDEHLIDYAAGSLPEPVALLVASHASMCPACHNRLDELDRIGGGMLETLEPEDVSQGLRASILARLDDEPVKAAPKQISARDGFALPQALRALIGADVEGLKWSSALGARHCSFLENYDGIKMRLIRLSPGASIPKHTHDGTELTLVFEGNFLDRGERYARGDVAFADQEVDHEPVAGTEGECLCLAVTTAPLRLTGPIGRYFNPFLKI